MGFDVQVTVTISFDDYISLLDFMASMGFKGFGELLHFVATTCVKCRRRE